MPLGTDPAPLSQRSGVSAERPVQLALTVTALGPPRTEHVEHERSGGQRQPDDDEGQRGDDESKVTVPGHRRPPGQRGADQRGDKHNVVESHSGHDAPQWQ